MCQPGYIEVDGNCVYEFGGSTLPDGTPKAPGNDGDKKPFCDTPLGKYVCDAVPVILVGGAGWFENKYGDKPEPPKPNSTPKTPAKPAEKTGMPVWGWIAIGLGVVAVVVVLVRRK